MKKTSMLSLAGLLMFLMSSWRVGAADFYVRVDFYSLSPNPVQIKTGDAVYWIDADQYTGPFMITGGWGSVWTPYGIQFNVGPGTYHYTAESAYTFDSWDGTVIVTPNYTPTVAISNPTNNSVLIAPASFSFEADAADANVNDISDVEFWVDGTLADDVFTPPYMTSVDNLAAGIHTLTAIVWDNSNATGTNTIKVTVIEPGPIGMDSCSFSGGKLIFRASGLLPGRTNVLQCSTNMIDWFPIQTNICDGTTQGFTNTPAGRVQFFRLMQMQ